MNKLVSIICCLVVLWFGWASAFYRSCNSHHKNDRSVCRLPESSAVEVLSKRKKAIECSNICEFLNAQHPSYHAILRDTYNLSYVYPDLTFKHYPNVPVINKSKPVGLQATYKSFLSMNLPSYPPITIPQYYISYAACIGFNFFNDSGLCQFFPFSNQANYSLSNSSLENCNYYQKATFGPCVLTQYRDCDDMPGGDEEDNGIYWVLINNSMQPLYCVFRDGIKYTVMMRRVDETTSFSRGWEEYKNGFGVMEDNFWLGNEVVHQITASGNYRLRVDIEYFTEDVEYQLYDKFIMKSEQDKYAVYYASDYGTAGNCFYQNQSFSALDQDNDNYRDAHCSTYFGSGWWYKACHLGILTGKYRYPEEPWSGNQLSWHIWGGKVTDNPLKSASMMLYREPSSP